MPLESQLRQKKKSIKGRLTAQYDCFNPETLTSPFMLVDPNILGLESICTEGMCICVDARLKSMSLFNKLLL